MMSSNDDLGITRRAALGAAGAAALSPAAVAMLRRQDSAAPAPNGNSAPPPDDNALQRQVVQEVGFTAQEAEAWILAADLAGAFFALPELHPMDAQEVASAIHIVQNKLLSRPTYRAYLERAKEAFGEGQGRGTSSMPTD